MAGKPVDEVMGVKVGRGVWERINRLKKQAGKVGWNNRPHDGKICKGRGKGRGEWKKKGTYLYCWM